MMQCSVKKAPGGTSRAGASVIDSLPHGLADEPIDRRKQNAAAARVDESALRQAVERYDGHVYNEGRAAIRTLLDRGARVVIVSGGYGLVLPDEAIGDYDCQFRRKMWPDRLIERSLATIAGEVSIKQVVGCCQRLPITPRCSVEPCGRRPSGACISSRLSPSVLQGSRLRERKATLLPPLRGPTACQPTG